MAKQQSPTKGGDHSAEIGAVRVPAPDQEFWRRTEAYMPKTKQGVFVRLDADVIAWLKARGKGYQTRMNAMLRVLMESDNAARPLGHASAPVMTSMGPLEVPGAGPAEGAAIISGVFNTAPALDIVAPTRRRRTRAVAS